MLAHLFGENDDGGMGSEDELGETCGIEIDVSV
jgi:hypothetical protein